MSRRLHHSMTADVGENKDHENRDQKTELSGCKRPFTHTPVVETLSVVAWLLKPNTIFTWVKPNMHTSLDEIQELTRKISYRELLHLFGEGPFRFLHDFSNVNTFDKKARMELVKWGMSYPKESIRAIRLRVSREQKLLSMAASAGTVALNLVGYDQKIVDDFAIELEGTTPFVISEN